MLRLVALGLAVAMQEFDEEALGDFSLAGFDLGVLPPGDTRIIGTVGNAGDSDDTVAFSIPIDYGLASLTVMEYALATTEAPTFATSPPTPVDATDVPTTSPTMRTEPPTTFDSRPFAFIFLAEGDEGFVATPARIPDMLGGLVIGSADTGDILPTLASATLNFGGSPVPPLPPVGQGFTIPLGPGTYVLTLTDSPPLNDFARYAVDLGVVLV